MKTVVLFLGLAMGVYIIGFGGPIKNKQTRQERRVSQGKQSGTLTQHETKVLALEQKHIKREIKLAKADGKITVNEARHIRKEQRQASQHIYNEKNDLQTK